MRIIGPADVNGKLSWTDVVAALEAGHTYPKAETGDTFLGSPDKTLLSRAARIDGLGFGVKSVTVLPDNPKSSLPTVQGGMLVFSDDTGALDAVIDSALITNWKTAADSVLGAKLLARPNCKSLLIVGAGSVAETLVRAYSEIFPGLESITIWNRTPERADALAASMNCEGYTVSVSNNLSLACSEADIISVATLSRDPVIKGEWVRPGTHVDLIGAFTPDMREGDDTLLQNARIFVDCFDTTIDHIGELMIPIKSGVIQRTDVLADFYGLLDGATGRQNDADITVFKNGGGAHLDLMTAHCILACLVD